MNRIYLNNDWQFRFDRNTEDFTQVRIPHTVKETPFNYFSEEEYQTVSDIAESSLKNFFAATAGGGDGCLGDAEVLPVEK